jgi:chaperone BCS1
MTLHRIAATVVTDFDGKITKVEEGEFNKAKNTTVTCFPTLRGTQPIKEFLDHVRDFAVPSRNNVVEICRPEREGPDECDFYWKSVYRPARDLDGVVMQGAVKNTLVSDIDFYLSRACRTFYENRGIPYRRGYLFYGPPGTGKTSISVSLASAYKLPLYVLNLNDLTDKSLMRLLSFVPKRSILFLEDVDIAGLDREHMVTGAVGRDGNPTVAKKKTVTLSGLLNCLDGPASVDGRLLIMTSNSPDSLDAALVRPGRCDKKILFGYVCPEVTAGLFANIFTRTAAELYKDEKSASDEHEIPAMAVQLASKIPTDAAITPAEVQAWLLSNRTDPVAALEGAAEWTKDIIETKLRGANVAKFTNEVKSIPTTCMFDTPPTSSRASSVTAGLEDFDYEASDLEDFDE